MEDRRKAVLLMNEAQFRSFVDAQFQASARQFEAHRELLAQNTALTQQIAASTQEIVDAFAVTKKGLHFFQTVGSFLNRSARWLLPIATLAGVVWAALHGHWPKGD